MARYRFGGRLNDLYVSADPGLGGALKAAPGQALPPLYDKPKWDGTRSVTTDFLVVDMTTGTGSASTTIIADADGYPPFFDGPDGVLVLYDLAGHGYYGRLPTGDTVDVPLADETAPGIVERASTAETLAGSDDARYVSPLKLNSRIDAHDTDTGSHQDLRDVVDQNTTAILNKADLVTGVVPDSQIASSTTGDADTLARRTSTGALAGASALGDDELVPLLQLRTEIADSSSLGTEVRAGTEAAVPIALVSSTVWTGLNDADLTVTDAASGDIYDIAYTAIYRGLTANDLKIRFQTNTTAATNKLTNPSFETNTTGWSAGPASASISRLTTGGIAADGTGFGVITALQAGSGTAWTSQTVPAAPGSVWTAAAEFRTGLGTPRSVRVDVQFLDGSGSAVRSDLGTSVLTNASTWTRITSVGSGTIGVTAPTGTVSVRMRIIVLAQAVNDTTRVDKAQLEPVAPIPVYGATGGGGSSALSIVGNWVHPAVGATAATDAPIRTIMRSTPTDVVTAGAIGAAADAIITGMFRITVGGTGLTDQVIALEAAQNVTDAGNATNIVYADSTIVKIA